MKITENICKCTNNIIQILNLISSRLEKDLCNPEFKEWNHLKGIPKSLIPIGGKPLIFHWLTIIQDYRDTENEVIIVVNDHFHPKYAIKLYFKYSHDFKCNIRITS